MNNRCINDLPINILRECCSLREITMFVLSSPLKYTERYVINYWTYILNQNLENIFKRHKKSLNITLKTYNISKNEIKEDKIIIDVKKITNLILKLLRKDIIVFIKINNYTYPYGFLIIPEK